MNFTVKEQRVRKHHMLHRYCPIDVNGGMFDAHNDHTSNKPTYCSLAESLEVDKSYIIWVVASSLKQTKETSSNFEIDRTHCQPVDFYKWK